tara:strand:- start:483 stop:662 length:180 start_codon:yes stop_codon:yes gene_type:complete
MASYNSESKAEIDEVLENIFSSLKQIFFYSKFEHPISFIWAFLSILTPKLKIKPEKSKR